MFKSFDRYFDRLERRHRIVFALVVGFAVITFWRGIWGLLDIMLFPEMAFLSYFFSFAVGLAILIATGYTIEALR